MITRITKFQLQKAHRRDFSEFMKQFRDELISVDGCQHFDVLKDKTDDLSFQMYMIWDEDEKLEDFRVSDLNKLLTDKIELFTGDNPTSWTVETVFDPEELINQKSLFD